MTPLPFPIRAHASVAGVAEYAQEKGAGFLLQKEIEYFHRCIDIPQRPLVAIVGGAKVSGKLEALRNMLERVDKMIIGGAMANTFLKSQGYAVGASKIEEDLLETADELLKQAKAKNVKVYLPVDVIAADTFCPGCGQQTGDDSRYSRITGWRLISAPPQCSASAKSWLTPKPLSGTGPWAPLRWMPMPGAPWPLPMRLHPRTHSV